ncbi:hypothetical protein ALP93_101773 [Pseudomonas syringae pv. helianthi]|nr:hypothetical protein ALP93_101773 [Pseudomonas syringae pv. helianthi]
MRKAGISPAGTGSAASTMAGRVALDRVSAVSKARNIGVTMSHGRLRENKTERLQEHDDCSTAACDPILGRATGCLLSSTPARSAHGPKAFPYRASRSPRRPP